jgi:hypothetical protein
MSLLDGKGKDGQPMKMEELILELNKSFDVKIGAQLDAFKKAGLSEAIKAQVDPVSQQLMTINESIGKILTSLPAGGAPGTGGAPGGGDGKGTTPEQNAQMKTLNETVATLSTKLKAVETARETAERKAEETDRFSAIRTSIQGLPFVNEKAAGTAFEIVKPFVKRLEDNTLVATNSGDNFPVPDFAKDYLEKEHAYLFRASGSSGSGAPAGGGNGGSSRIMGQKVDVNTIKVGMKAEDRQAAVDAINQVLQAQ